MYPLRLADGSPAGELSVAVGAETLDVAFRPTDGAPFEDAFLIGTSEGEFRYDPETPGDGRLSIPWEGLADDVCGRTVTVALASLPEERVAFSVACQGAVPTEAATSTGGSSGGGGNCPR